MIPKGGYNVDLHLGRFNETLDGIEEWIRITENEKADFYGDCWIEQ